jgi:hypothetical protein
MRSQGSQTITTAVTPKHTAAPTSTPVDSAEYGGTSDSDRATAIMTAKGTGRRLRLRGLVGRGHLLTSAPGRPP